jgi:hypothetical protein
MRKIRITKGWRILLICAVLIAGTAFIGSSTATGAARSKTLPITMVVQGIKIDISNAKYDAATLSVDLCFDMPSQLDWLPHDTYVTAQGEQVIITDLVLINYEKNEKGEKIRRCDHLYTTLSPDLAKGEITLVVPILVAYRSVEVPNCAEVNRKLSAAGISIACKPWYGDYGGGGWGWEVLEKPASMSLEEANRIVGEISAIEGRVEGPWTFVVNLP